MKAYILLAGILCQASSCGRSSYSSEPALLTYILYLLGFFLFLFILLRLTKQEPEKELSSVHIHRYYHFEDFQLSSKEFYATMHEIITERTFPSVSAKVVALSTGSMLDQRREYLEVKHKDMVFYICAAPFGKNFFISYWLKDISDGCLIVFWRRVFGYVERKTFYQIDQEAMFYESIHNALMKGITKVATTKGLRTLTPEELTSKTI